MVKYTQIIHRHIADGLFDVFDHFLRLALKGLNRNYELLRHYYKDDEIYKICKTAKTAEY